MNEHKVFIPDLLSGKLPYKKGASFVPRSRGKPNYSVIANHRAHTFPGDDSQARSAGASPPPESRFGIHGQATVGTPPGSWCSPRPPRGSFLAQSLRRHKPPVSDRTLRSLGAPVALPQI